MKWRKDYYLWRNDYYLWRKDYLVAQISDLHLCRISILDEVHVEIVKEKT